MRIEIKFRPLLGGWMVIIDGNKRAIYATREQCEEWLDAEVDESWRDYEVKS